jgi:hypothetical protein
LWSAQRSWPAPGSSLGGAELPLAASWRSRSWPSSPAAPRQAPTSQELGKPALGLLEEAAGGHRGGNLVMSLTGPHDRLPSWPTAAPAQPAGSPALPLPGMHQQRTGRHLHPASPQRPGKWAIALHAAHRGNRSVQQRLPEIDTGRTLIARSSAGSVGSGRTHRAAWTAGSIGKPWRMECNRIAVRARNQPRLSRPNVRAERRLRARLSLAGRLRSATSVRRGCAGASAPRASATECLALKAGDPRCSQ